MLPWICLCSKSQFTVVPALGSDLVIIYLSSIPVQMPHFKVPFTVPLQLPPIHYHQTIWHPGSGRRQTYWPTWMWTTRSCRGYQFWRRAACQVPNAACPCKQMRQRQGWYWGWIDEMSTLSQAECKWLHAQIWPVKLILSKVCDSVDWDGWTHQCCVHSFERLCSRSLTPLPSFFQPGDNCSRNSRSQTEYCPEM